jgi:hypothetical protein
VRDFMSRLTVTVDVYLQAQNADEATEEVAKIMEDLTVTPGSPYLTDVELIGVDAERPTEMAP